MEIGSFPYPLLPQPRTPPSNAEASPYREASDRQAVRPAQEPQAITRAEASLPARQGQQQRVEMARFREVYPEQPSPQARKVVDAYSANMPSRVPETLAGIDDFA